MTASPPGPVDLTRQLIRFDTTNPPGAERGCIGYVRDVLDGAGAETRLVAREEERPNLIARVAGRGDAPPLLLHGHVDVVSAEGRSWRQPPFSGALHDGCVWGRGALDMKSGVAMFMTVAMRAAAQPPAGDLILAVLSDEELGGRYGAGFVVREHPELFEGVRYALGEGGGFVLEVAGVRFYPVKVTEKQHFQLEATAHGPSGHGALPVRGSATGRIGRLLAAVDEARLPLHVTPVAREMLDVLGRHTGLADELSDPARIAGALDGLGPAADIFDAAVRNTVNPTIVRGGETLNVVPHRVDVELDARALPGRSPDDVIAELRALPFDDRDLELATGRVEPACPQSPDMALCRPLYEAVRGADAAGVPLPMLDAGVTDARFFAQLGIQTYGFLPMPTPPGFGRERLVHGHDERIPVDTLVEGTEILDALVPALFSAAAEAQNTGDSV